MKYEDKEEIERVVREFESATVSREEWKHPEHLIVALRYVCDNGLEEASARMRRGILNLLENGFKVDLSAEMPYHATLTVFWMNTVHEFNVQHLDLPFERRAGLLVETFDKDHPLKFYSRVLLFSDRARSEYVEPDLLVPAAVGAE